MIYIGSADSIKNDLPSHERTKNWETLCGPGQYICYSYAPLEKFAGRDRVEATLIHQHKPAENINNDLPRHFDETTISIAGDAELLNTHFKVQKELGN